MHGLPKGRKELSNPRKCEGVKVTCPEAWIKTLLVVRWLRELLVMSEACKGVLGFATPVGCTTMVLYHMDITQLEWWTADVALSLLAKEESRW